MTGLMSPLSRKARMRAIASCVRRRLLAFERHEPGDGLVAALNDDVFAGFDLGDEFRETGFRLADFDGDGHGRLAEFRRKRGRGRILGSFGYVFYLVKQLVL